MNKIKKIITISAIILLLVATLGTFAVFFGKEDFAKIKDKWNDTFQKEEVVVESSNLIKNSNFQTNTTGITTFTSENVTSYHTAMFDEWKSESAMGEGALIVVTENGLYAKFPEEYSLDSTSTDFMIGQYVEGIDNVFGQVVTLTFSVDNVVYSKTFEFSEKDYHYSVGTVDNLLVSMCRYSTTNLSNVVLKFNAGFEGVVNWIQLEQGSVFTGYVA